MRILPFCLLVCSMGALTSIASAQQARVSRLELPPTVTLYASLYLGDEELQDELKMSPQQRAKARALLDPSFERMIECMYGNIKRRDALSKTQETVLAGLLQPEQRERLRQVVLQHLSRIPPGPPTLAGDAALAGRLKLDDEQRKQLRQRKPLAEVLSAGQKEEWARVVGKPYPRRLVMRGVKALQNNAAPYEVGRLLSEPIETELKLTAEQLARLEEIAGKWGDAIPDTDWQMTQKLATSLTAEALAVLTEPQKKRYEQLRWQLYHFIQPTQLYNLNEVAERLKLTAEQRQTRTRLLQEMGLAALEQIAANEKLADIPPKLKKLEAEMEEKWQARLTPQQRDLVKEMLGTPGNIKAIYYCRTPNLPWEKRELPYRPSYLMLEAVRYADSSVFHREVKASEEQVRKLKALKERVAKEETAAEQPEPEERRKERAAAGEKALAGILDGPQLQRWKELTYRHLSKNMFSITYATPELLGVAEFRAGMKLTEGQVRRLQRGALISSVVSAEQKQAGEKLIGNPVAATSYSWPDSSQTLWNPIVGEQVRIIMAPQVQTALGLTAEQKKTLAEMESKAKALPFINRTNGPEWLRATEKRLREHQRAISRVLTEKQNRRWKQIACTQLVEVAQKRIQGLLSLTEIQEELKLTPPQKDRMRRILADQSELQGHVSHVTILCKLDGKEILKAQMIPRDRTEKALRKLLSAEQDKALKEILGEPLGYIIVYQRNGFDPH